MKRKRTHYAITVLCEDRVGLVARFTGAITRLGGNIEDLEQTVRLGYFTITLMATFDQGHDAKLVKAELEKTGKTETLAVSVLPRQNDPGPPPVQGEPFVLIVSGRDAPGIFTAVTSCLAERTINVENLICRTGNGLFTITGDLTVPEEVDIKALRLNIMEILAVREVNVTLMHGDIFAATNQISMPAAHTGGNQ